MMMESLDERKCSLYEESKGSYRYVAQVRHKYELDKDSCLSLRLVPMANESASLKDYETEEVDSDTEGGDYSLKSSYDAEIAKVHSPPPSPN